MPELPEVETIRRGLESWVVGKTIAQVEVWNPRIVRTQPGGAVEFISLLEGAQIRAAVRRGKFLWLELSESLALVIHFGMSGQIHVWNETPAERRKHEHIRVTFTDGSGYSHTDQRTFGKAEVVPLIPCEDGFPGGHGSLTQAIPASATHIARDPLDPGFKLEQVAQQIHKLGTAIKTLLLKQNLISGIGNIYADEALFAVGLHGSRPGYLLQEAQIVSLLEAAQQVMRNAVLVGGTSFDELYVNVSGEPGYFAISLNVYGRNGHPCRKCGNLILKESIGGRTHHYCEICQPPGIRNR